MRRRQMRWKALTNSSTQEETEGKRQETSVFPLTWKGVSDIDIVDQPSQVGKVLRLVHCVSVNVFRIGRKDIHTVRGSIDKSVVIYTPAAESDGLARGGVGRR